MTFLILKVTLLQSLKFFLGFFSFFFNSELNIFQILKSIGHENGKRNIEIQGQAQKIQKRNQFFVHIDIWGAKIHIVFVSIS